MLKLNHIYPQDDEFITGYFLDAKKRYQKEEAHQDDDSYCYVPFGAVTFLEARGLPDAQRTRDAVMRPISFATVANAAILNLDITLPFDMTKQPDDYSDEEPLHLRPEIEDFEDDKIQLYSEVYRVYHECSEQDWDSYDGMPISDKTFFEAREIIRLLPQDLPLPEVMPEPTGEIAFEWYKDRKHVFVISVEGRERISYAGLFGSRSQTHGVEYFSDRFPQLVVNNIQRLFDWG